MDKEKRSLVELLDLIGRELAVMSPDEFRQCLKDIGQVVRKEDATA